MDVIWLKKDVRLHDHAPLAEIARTDRPFCILYLYEPDQLSEKTVHGSHVCFVNEGLVDFDKQLSLENEELNCTRDDRESLENNNKRDTQHQLSKNEDYQFRTLTVCHRGAVFTFNAMHRQRKILRILAHEETGHLKSYARDKRVRSWCRNNGVLFSEYNQTGVTRCLSNRDDFSKKFNSFLSKPLAPNLNLVDISKLQKRVVTNLQLEGRCNSPIHLSDLTDIPLEHREDRPDRQSGGEKQALATLSSFLESRGSKYASGISSPNSSWTTGSRLSPYLTWGHISLKYVIYSVRSRQSQLKKRKKDAVTMDGPWLRSLSAFSSRIHWRSHFIQKLESEPEIEIRDLCPAYQHLRREPNDWNEDYYKAWSTGTTGFPFVDASMRCLIKHGWINFRMRAMLVSFATYNLWLDWKRIAPHLARLFLDYEPGIHYPQIQMQAGTTGINAMRVYNVSKQGRDQDSEGIFIRKYVPELRNVPLAYLHEPSKMPRSVQEKYSILIGETPAQLIDKREKHFSSWYPAPIVNELQTARIAKEKVANVKNKTSTKQMANQVYKNHGSRSARSNEMNCAKRKALSSSSRMVEIDEAQKSIKKMFFTPDSTHKYSSNSAHHVSDSKTSPNRGDSFFPKKKVNTTESSPLRNQGNWSCTVCTFINTKHIALVCSMCRSVRNN